VTYPPEAPTGASAAPLNASASVTWTAPTTNGGAAISGYRIDRATGPTFVDWSTINANTGTTATSCSSTGLTNDTSYKYRIYALNGNGTSTSYAETNAATPSASLFISTWETTDTVTLPLADGTFGGVTNDYDFTVYWGDGTSTEVDSASEGTHSYSSSGTYTVSIDGTIKGFRFANSGDKTKIRNVSQWGSLNFGNGGSYFSGASGLTATATDAPDLTGTTDLSSTFDGASSFNTNISSWDTSAVTSMGGMFAFATSFNQPLVSAADQWSTESVTSLYAMFQGASSFNQDVSSWDTSNVDNTAYAFNGASAFNEDLSSWDTSNVTDMASMFAGATTYDQPMTTTPGGWNTSRVTNFGGMFSEARAFNQDLSSWDTGSVTEMWYMFSDATNFDQNIGAWNIESLTDASEMFANVTLSLANYNGLLVGWNAQEENSGVSFSGGNSMYSAGLPHESRADLVDVKSWSITDGGLSPRPGAPFTVQVVQQNEAVVVSWDEAPVPDGGDPVLSYTATALVGGVPVDPAKTCTTPDGSTVTCTVTGLTNGTEYTFIVVAVSDAGPGPDSDPSVSVTPGPIEQVVTFTNTPLSVVVGGTANGVATSNGDGAVTYGSTDTAACTVNSSGLVTGVAVGTNNCVITATAAATDDWLEGSVQQTFSVGQGPAQTVTFTNAPLSVVVGGTVNGAATSNGDGAVTYGSTNTAACTVNSSGVVTGVAAGTNNCVITATAAETGNWAQGSAQQTFGVGKADQAITFTDPSDTTFTPAGTVSLSASATSGLTVSFASTTTPVCTVSGSTVTMVAAGTCSITASQAGDDNYNAATDVPQSFAIGKAGQTITFTDPTDTTFTPAGTVSLSASATSGLDVSFASTTTPVCTVSASTVTMIGAGTC
ncbi:MAG: BspA family leucine-rich repeat surface protein, partial [Candidatus Nanopelagicales bacterium]